MPEITTATFRTTFDPLNDYITGVHTATAPDELSRILLRYVREVCLYIPVGDETTAITAAANKAIFRNPFGAITVTGIRASLSTAQTSGSIFTVDVNEGGTTILSTKLTIDNTEKTSTTAAAAAVISDTALADDAEISVDVDQIGDGTAKGLKIYIIGYKAS